MPRSSKHGHGRLVLTNTRRPWHGVPGCVCEVLTTARQSIVCGCAVVRLRAVVVIGLCGRAVGF